MPVLASAAIDAMPGQLLGTANALNSMLRQFGAALGTAAVGTLLVERSGHSPIDVGSFRVVWAFLGTLTIATIPFALRLIRPGVATTGRGAPTGSRRMRIATLAVSRSTFRKKHLRANDQ